jgi:hypothetical protein
MDLTLLETVRSSCHLLLNHPESLRYWTVEESALDNVTDKILSLIQRDYASLTDIPPHSRWRHFESKRPAIKELLKDMEHLDIAEQVKRLVDLFVVSVLLDAGSGGQWTFVDQDKTVYARSEGLAMASLAWFKAGGFSAKKNDPWRVDGERLLTITLSELCQAMQVSPTNPLVGLEGRLSVLNRLGQMCESFPQFFQRDGEKRPGILTDYLLEHCQMIQGKKTVSLNVLWKVVMEGFSGIWPATRTCWKGRSLGDVWPCEALLDIKKHSTMQWTEEECMYHSFLPFHKLSQWLTYSLMEPVSLLDLNFSQVELLTGLPEYRNGGLLIDMGVLIPKVSLKEPKQVSDGVIVEWRGLTVALLDKIADKVRSKLGLNAESLPLAKVLEAGTWKAGRELAAEKRPETRSPPILIISDGTVF